ncbi:Flp family type IVb pilin [Indiicoccus explosivorum]|uniref:Flp family type IVb pilin n=1 Tax=Indiicoccus explosivorum TaxID=1917864 RepID=UPI000B44E2FE|nr:Flp family type IVb pilin [Indiicoccus explosivorum]
MMELFKALFTEEDGQGMTEYGLILGLIAVGVIAAIALLGDQLKVFFDNITGNITTETGNTGTPTP